MASNRNVKHFGEDKKSHTKIKHAIFSKTLSRSLSIANGLSYKKPYSTYSYADLFAGKGTFEDGSNGSPLIALETFIKHIKHSSNSNNFKTIQMLNIEKNKEDYDSLVTTLNEKLSIYCDEDCKGKIKVFAGNDSWEKHEDSVKEHLKNNSWGFVFADPFSTELDLNKFTAQIRDVSDVKDIMIFANFNTLARQNGRLCENDVERICRALAISEELLLSDQDFSDQFKEAFSGQLKSFKVFAIGVAFPVEVKSNLIAADYFYLILGTNSIKVADGFLESYEKEIMQNKKGLMCDNLFGDNKILDFLKDKTEVTFFELLEFLFNNFLSWKDCVCASDIPTIANTVAKINKMLDAKEIEIECQENLVYKRADKSRGNKIGHLKNSAISHKRDTEAIRLKYLPTSGQQAFIF